MSKRDYYDVLSINSNANKSEIKKAFRTLAQKYHPDVNKEPEAADRFKEINEAYQVLSDDQKRAAYDRFGHAGVEGAAGGFGGGTGDFGGFGDLGSIFEEFFGGGVDVGGRRSRTRARRGADLRADVDITFEEAVFGVERELDVPRMESCDRCDGDGAEPGTTPTTCSNCNGRGEVQRRQQNPLFGTVITSSTCPTCGGSGEIITTPCNQCNGQKRIRINRKLQVKIPAGVDDGTRIRLAGEGEIGQLGGTPGNLYVVISVASHPIFVRNDFDILLEMPINMAQAALGANVIIPTVDGTEEELEIPVGTQTGRSFRKRGMGVPRLNRSGRGDMVITARVMTPTDLNDEQKELLRQLAETFDDESIEQNKGFFDRIFG